jgi:hypothetical protein
MILREPGKPESRSFSSSQGGFRQVTDNPVSRELHIQRANPCSAINFRVADNPPETPQGYLVNLNA